MHVRALFTFLPAAAALSFALCFTNDALARGPEWFDPTPPKPAPEEGRAEPPAPTPAEGKADATKGRPDAGTPDAAPAPAPAVAPCPPPAPPARAPLPKPARLRAQTEWYGWQTITADVTSLALMSAGSASENGGTALAGLGVYLLGAPVLHAVNGEFGKGAASLGVRVGAPFAGGAVGLGLGVATCRGEDPYYAGALACVVGASALGVVAGGITAMVIDSAVLAKKEVRPRRDFSIAPSVLPTRQGTTFGLAGTF